MSFSETGALASQRRDGTGMLFASGEVMVFGGRDANGTLATTEVFDPNAGAWGPGPSMLVDRFEETVVATPYGILVAGGTQETGRQTQTPSLNTVQQDEWYDGNQGGFTAVNSLNVERRAACGSLLGNGGVIVAGGLDAGGYTLGSIEVFDPQGGFFAPAGSLAVARSRAVSRRIDDDVLVVGGVTVDQSGGLQTVDSVETVNATGSIGWFPVVYGGRLSHTVTHLYDGRILIVGGFASPSNDISGMDGYAVGSAEFFTRP